MSMRWGMRRALATSLHVGLTAAGVPTDGPLSVKVPRDSTDWAILGNGALDYVWLCQDASGNLDAAEGTDLTAAGGGVHLYERTITGWTRKFVGSTADGDVCSWRNGAGVGPDPSSESVAWVGYIQFPSAPSANRVVFTGASSAPNLLVTLLTTGKLRLTCGGVTVDGTAVYTDSLVHALALDYNLTLEHVKLWTDQEVITGTFADVSDSTEGIGATAGAATAVYRCGWLAAAVGANAEINWGRALINTGWPVSYST